MNVLKIRNKETGEWQDIPALVGPPGPKGEDGVQGPAGSNGYTPVRGTDYWTDADKTEIVLEVLASLPPGFNVEIVENLPGEAANSNTIYLLPVNNSGTSLDYYDEYLYINGSFEQVGSTRVNLSNYYTKSEIDSKGYQTADQVNALITAALSAYPNAEEGQY